jgi:asparagine synthase (glutamine-hydrolysing)
MSTLAAVVAWDGAPDRTEIARRMLTRLSDRSPDGISVAEAPAAALGIGKLVVSQKQGHLRQPLIDEAAGLYSVSDVRIDNREELRGQLRLGPAATDAEIVLAAYVKWGPICPDHLVGDFAFIVWDSPNRRLFAARDPFGVRPLVYRRLSGRLLLASDVEQILTVDPSAWKVDDLAVVEYLQLQWRFPDRTFWEPIKTVPAGHCLMADDRSVQVLRWWRPPAAPEIIEDHEECYREFRRLFRQAVADRLDSDYPVLVQLSGGFDSSCIAVVAGQVGASAPLRAVGAVHPGLECDESVYMDAVKEVLPFPTEYWDGTKIPPLDHEQPSLCRPGHQGSTINGTRGDLEIAARDGARAIVNGYGGDVWQSWAEGQLDHLRERRWRQLWRDVFMRPNATWVQRLRILNLSLRLHTPDRLKRTVRSMMGSGAGSRPAGLLDRWSDDSNFPEARRWDSPGPFWSAMQSRQLEEIAGSRFVRAVENRQFMSSANRVEARFPFLDLRCLDLLWRLPGSIWRPTGYDSRFHPIALRALLPPEIVSRRRKTVFSSALADKARMAQTSLRSLVASQPSMHIDRYCRKAQINGLLRTDSDRLTSRDWSTLCRLQSLEAWFEIVYAGPAADHATREQHGYQGKQGYCRVERGP